MDISVMTFNLRVDNQGDGENAWGYRTEKVISTIKANDPQFIGTQEGLFEMISELKTGLPAYDQIGEGRGGGTNDEYGAIFYKKDDFELLKEGQFWLSETPDVPNSSSWNTACPRICTWGEFRSVVQPTEIVTVFNTHLDHVSQEARIKGIKLIDSKIKPILDRGMPVILTGDFNVEPDNDVVKVLRENGLKEIVTEVKTFHDFKGGTSGRPIDYIFTSKQADVLMSKVDCTQIDGKYPSDHYPVIAKLKF